MANGDAQPLLEINHESGGLTVFTLADALTRIAGKTRNEGVRTETDQRTARLFQLAV